jgi:hypothetical protein
MMIHEDHSGLSRGGDGVGIFKAMPTPPGSVFEHRSARDVPPIAPPEDGLKEDFDLVR